MGAGKSRVLCQKAWWVARTHPGVTVALFRKTAATLPATTARTFERDVVDYDFIARRNKSESWWELTNGSRIYFLGLDPDPVTGVPSKVGSLDLGWAGVDEAVELSEEDWIMLLGRLRDPHIDWHQLAAATNPAHRRSTGCRMRMLDEPQGANSSPSTATSSSRRTTWRCSQNLPTPPPAEARARASGPPPRAPSGTSPTTRCAGTARRPFHRVVAGLDWGFVHPLACEVVGQTGSGRMAVIDEVYAKRPHARRGDPGACSSCTGSTASALFYADPSEPAYILRVPAGRAARHRCDERRGPRHPSGCDSHQGRA